MDLEMSHAGPACPAGLRISVSALFGHLSLVGDTDTHPTAGPILDFALHDVCRGGFRR